MNIELEYKYCPKCKNNLIKKETNLLICEKCKTHFYVNPRPTNGVIFENNQGQILLLKRKRSPKKGYWDIPGGFVDLNESLEESVKREIREELGIEIKEFKYFGSFTGRYLYKGQNYHTLCFIFISKLNQSTKTSSEEFDRLVFFDKNKIPFDKIAFIEVKKTLKKYLFPFH